MPNDDAYDKALKMHATIMRRTMDYQTDPNAPDPGDDPVRHVLASAIRAASLEAVGHLRHAHTVAEAAPGTYSDEFIETVSGQRYVALWILNRLHSQIIFLPEPA